MKLTKLKQSNDYDVHKWLEEELELSPYQKSKMRKSEMLRYSKFYFYEDNKEEKPFLLWRLTLPLIPIYIISIWAFSLCKWIFTGNNTISQNFLHNFHYKWMNKLNINL